MSKIPELLWEHINTGWHNFTGIVSVILPDGYTQVSPRGSLVVLDGETFAYWDLGSGRTHETVTDGTKITVYFQKGPLHGEGLLVGGVARFYGTTSLHFDDEIRENVWDALVDTGYAGRHPDKKGLAVVVHLERSEDLMHRPLSPDLSENSPAAPPGGTRQGMGASGPAQGPDRPAENGKELIPASFHEHLNTSFPPAAMLLSTALADGYAQVSPRGSLMVYDHKTLAFWDRGRGRTHDELTDGSQVTVYFRKPELREDGTLPTGGIARFYGRARMVDDDNVRQEVYDRMAEAERARVPEMQGSVVLIDLERAEDLLGKPLAS